MIDVMELIYAAIVILWLASMLWFWYMSSPARTDEYVDKLIDSLPQK